MQRVQQALAAQSIIPQPLQLAKAMAGRIAHAQEENMSVQEAALYGELVLALRDHAAQRLAALDAGLDAETAGAQVDEFIRDWFFMPQKELYGSAPREVIWREQLGQQNPLPKEYAAEVFDDCDCPICRAMREEIENAESDEAHGHFWGYAPDTCLLERYDPEGAEKRWEEEFAQMDAWREDRAQRDAPAEDAASFYAAPPLPAPQIDAETFLSVLQHPWLDPALHQAARKLAERCDVPLPSVRIGLPYRRITQAEALSLAAGLHGQGVEIEALLAQVDAWPYENIALDWFVQPEKNAALIIGEMGDGPAPGRKAEFERYRHHRDFILALAQLMPPAARLWLSGWLDAVGYGATAKGP